MKGCHDVPGCLCVSSRGNRPPAPVLAQHRASPSISPYTPWHRPQTAPYPSAPGGGTRSPRAPAGSAAVTSSSSEEPALDDSASLSASRISRGLAL